MAQGVVSFEQWVQHIFNHPITDPAWYWDLDADERAGANDAEWTAATTVAFLTETFMQAGTVLLSYSDAQVNQGLNYLVSGNCSDWMYDVLDDSVPWLERRQCIHSIYTLFEQCFAKRCSPHLSHLDEPGANPLNSVCYMWWDSFPAYGQPKNPARREVDAALLRVMQQTLYLDSDACCESALHGLGHWRMYYPKVTLIIDEFLTHGPKLRDDLAMYALQARRGRVL